MTKDYYIIWYFDYNFSKIIPQAPSWHTSKLQNDIFGGQTIIKSQPEIFNSLEQSKEERDVSKSYCNINAYNTKATYKVGKLNKTQLTDLYVGSLTINDITSKIEDKEYPWDKFEIIG